MSKSVNLNSSSYQNLLDLVQAANSTQPIGNFNPVKITCPVPTVDTKVVTTTLTATQFSAYKAGSTVNVTYDRLSLVDAKADKTAYDDTYILVNADTVASLLLKTETELALLKGDTALKVRNSQTITSIFKGTDAGVSYTSTSKTLTVNDGVSPLTVYKDGIDTTYTVTVIGPYPNAGVHVYKKDDVGVAYTIASKNLVVTTPTSESYTDGVLGANIEISTVTTTVTPFKTYIVTVIGGATAGVHNFLSTDTTVTCTPSTGTPTKIVKTDTDAGTYTVGEVGGVATTIEVSDDYKTVSVISDGSLLTDYILDLFKRGVQGDDADDGLTDTTDYQISIVANKSSFVYWANAPITLIETVKVIKPTIAHELTNTTVGGFAV